MSKISDREYHLRLGSAALAMVAVLPPEQLKGVRPVLLEAAGFLESARGNCSLGTSEVLKWAAVILEKAAK